MTLTLSLKLSALNVNSSPSTSLAESAIVNGVSSSVVSAPTSASIGASFTGVTVNSNISESVNSPSLTVTEISTDPNQLLVGVIVS